MKKKGLFITFEGLDFSGKSTQSKLLYAYLQSKKIQALWLREPGGTKISEKIRQIILDKENPEMFSITEYLLFSASRSQLVNEVIIPNIKKGVTVICDRYFDSSTAYQGYAGKLDVKKIKQINEFATGDLNPDITFFIDIDHKFTFKRAALRNSKDRMENKSKKYFEKVYDGFLEISKKNKSRYVMLNGHRSIKDIQWEIQKIVNGKLKLKKIK